MYFRRTFEVDLARRRYASRFGVFLLKQLFRADAIPFAWIDACRRLSSYEDALLPANGITPFEARDLENPFLRRELTGYRPSLWAMNAVPLNFLERRVRDLQPKAILEFGSGLSTVCMAQYMREIWPGERRTFIYSIEQEKKAADDTFSLLQSVGLEGFVRVLVRPVSQQNVAGVSLVSYDLPPAVLESFFGQTRPKFVVVDGPFVSGLGRFATLLLARDFLAADTVFFLDDALRDVELEVARRWAKLPGFSIHGLYLIRTGILEGRIAGR